MTMPARPAVHVLAVCAWSVLIAAEMSLAGLAARGESLAAFGRRCIPAGGVAPPSNTPGILGRRAWPAGRIVALGATPDFHRGLLVSGRNVAFVSRDGTQLTGMLYESPTRPAPGVVLVHMLGRSKDEWSVFADRLQNAGATVLALDLRGHGSSGGNGSMLPLMAGDVRAALEWLASRPGVRPGHLGVVGASLGANLAAQAAGEVPAARAIALISPSLDYRGVRLDAAVMKKLGARPVWMASSAEDPYALRTVKELASIEGGAREQHLSTARAHGTALIAADHNLSAALVDWLRRTLIF